MPFSIPVQPDYEGLLRCIRREGRPGRVHFIELFLDGEVRDALCQRFDLLRDLDPAAADFEYHKEVRLQRFLGYDYVPCRLTAVDWTYQRQAVADTGPLPRQGGREFMELHTGPITTWPEFEAYPWPDPAQACAAAFEWYQKHLPDDMCVIARGLGHFAENLCWLMGYETLCYALHDQRDLVRAIAERVLAIDRQIIRHILQFDRVKIVWASDDMGFRTGTLIGPDDLRQFVLSGHQALAELAHAAGRPYILHSCGQLEPIMADLLGDVRIDGKHSFEDAIEPVETFYRRYHPRVAVLGGLDVDFLCRADVAAIRRRVRATLDACADGGYCLGTGNSVANYIPVENYLAMMDEGQRYGR